MKLFFLKSLLLTSLFITNGFCQILPLVELSGKSGGRLDGNSWKSDELKGKVHALFYVDPDEKDLNNAASEALSNAKLPLDKYGSVAIINMAATWLPNFAIANSLKEKQKKYPDTLYLKDLKKVFVKSWKLKDDSSNILIFDKKGQLVEKFMGKLSDEDIKKMLKAVKDNL